MSLQALEAWLREQPINQHRSVRLSVGECELREYPVDVAKGYGKTLEEAVTLALEVAEAWAATKGKS